MIHEQTSFFTLFVVVVVVGVDDDDDGDFKKPQRHRQRKRHLQNISSRYSVYYFAIISVVTTPVETR